MVLLKSHPKYYASDFEQLIRDAGYTRIGSAPAKEIESRFGGVILLSPE